jgi:hypothetical protein
MSGVSIDNPSAPSDADLYMRLAVEGDSNFMKRLQALADSKASHDEALAELNLGKAAKAALDDAQVKQAEAAAKLAEASTTLETAKNSAADIVAKAEKDAAEMRTRAKAEAAASGADARESMAKPSRRRLPQMPHLLPPMASGLSFVSSAKRQAAWPRRQRPSVRPIKARSIDGIRSCKASLAQWRQPRQGLYW